VDSSFIPRACRRYNAISISALRGKNLDNLLLRIEGMLWKDMDPITELGIGLGKTAS